MFGLRAEWLHGKKNPDCVILCGRVLISALLMWNIAAKQGLVDQSSFSPSPLSGKPIPGGLKAENELAKTFLCS